MSWRAKLCLVVVSILLCVLIAGSIYGAILATRAIYRAATCPTTQEVVDSIPKEMIPPGSSHWSPTFGGVMVNNGGWDYVIMTDGEGKTWEFARKHRGDNWTKQRLYWSNEKRD